MVNYFFHMFKFFKLNFFFVYKIISNVMYSLLININARYLRRNFLIKISTYIEMPCFYHSLFSQHFIFFISVRIFLEILEIFTMHLYGIIYYNDDIRKVHCLFGAVNTQSHMVSFTFLSKKSKLNGTQIISIFQEVRRANKTQIFWYVDSTLSNCYCYFHHQCESQNYNIHISW